jgi:hypothetical protein
MYIYTYSPLLVRRPIEQQEDEDWDDDEGDEEALKRGKAPFKTQFVALAMRSLTGIHITSFPHHPQKRT